MLPHIAGDCVDVDAVDSGAFDDYDASSNDARVAAADDDDDGLAGRGIALRVVDAVD